MYYSVCCNDKICGHLGRHLGFHLHELTAFFFASKRQTLLNKLRDLTHCYTFVILLSTSAFGFFLPYRNISRKSTHWYGVFFCYRLIRKICRTMWSVSLSWIQMRVINLAGFCHKRSWTMRHTLILGRRIRLPENRLLWGPMYKLYTHCDLLSGKGGASGGRM